MKVKKAADMPAIDLNPQFKRALEVMEESNRHVFITGRAGTGKSTPEEAGFLSAVRTASAIDRGR